MIEKVLKLGNPVLHKISEPILQNELADLKSVIKDLHDILIEFRNLYGYGRAIAAPQIGVLKRLIYINIDSKSTIIINPIIENPRKEMFELWDDCLCFPNLYIKVKRHKSLTLKFLDENWKEHNWNLEDSLSELIQHEYDHLDGILATQRAIDDKSYRIK